MGSGERIVAGWVLQKRLGSGGYGEVWRARRRHVDIVRAVKLIPIVNDGAFESWRHEIGRLEALNHPNVVRFYDADIVVEGMYRDYAWIATELCERSLSETLRARNDHSLSWPEAEQLLDSMLAALAAAHDAGMVHRDIKPANVLWHSSGTWKLCDFGTARLVPADGTHPMTKVIGTSPYMSPAAHRGQQNQAADLYALGVTLHEALRAERLHVRPEGMSDSEYIKRVLDTPPTVSRDLPRRWRTVVSALIGEHGDLGAARLAEWFTETRGDAPPPAGRVVAAAGPFLVPPQRAAVPPPRPPGPTVAERRRIAQGPVVVSGPMAPRPKRNGRRWLPALRPGMSGAAAPAPAPGSVAPQGAVVRNGGAAVGRTGATELAKPNGVARSNGGTAATDLAPNGRANGGTAPTDLAAGHAGSDVAAGTVVRSRRPEPRVFVPAPPKPPRPPAPTGRSNGANGAANPPTQRQPPAPAPPTPRPWDPVGLDPTAVMGRRIVAALLDWTAVVVLAGIFYAGAVVDRYEQVPDGGCSVLEQQFESCVTLGSDAYVSDAGRIAFTPFLVITALVVFVGFQGLTAFTPGKLLTGLRVVGPDGRRPGLLRALVRTVLWVVDGFPWPVPVIGTLLAATTRRHRRFGDMVAGTVVIRRRAAKR